LAIGIIAKFLERGKKRAEGDKFPTIINHCGVTYSAENPA
jgi:hypothetical protein